MEKSKHSSSREINLTDSTKLAIRDEVEKRVEQREAIYWKFGGLFVAVVILFFAVLWKVSVSEIREIVEKQLAEKEVVKAKDRIMAINSAAEDMNRNLTAISTSMNTNQQSFIERLNQIKQQDNIALKNDVVLKDDFSKLFVIQTITNLNEIDASRKISLDYEPIPQTFNIFMNEGHQSIGNWKSLGYVDKNTFIITNSTAHMTAAGGVQFLQIEYMRKSLR